MLQLGVDGTRQDRGRHRRVERVDDRVRLRLVAAPDARSGVGLQVRELEGLERGLREDVLAKSIDVLFVGRVLEKHLHPLSGRHVGGVDVRQDGVGVGAVEILERAEEQPIVHLGDAARLDGTLKNADER